MELSSGYVLFILVSAVAILFLLILKFRINAFISLLVVSMYAGIVAGMPLQEVLASIREGMGNTLGFVAIVVGLGAIFGQILESTGGAEALAHGLIRRLGIERASWAMTLTGFLVAIPVFLDVGFILLVPIVYALARDTRRSLLYYGIPLLAGLAVTHSFIPPTPGPVAVADILSVPLGWVILLGFLLGIPTAILAGPLFGKYIAKKIFLPVPEYFDKETTGTGRDMPSFLLTTIIIGIPLFLILVNTFTTLLIKSSVLSPSVITDILVFLGHPFTALIIAILLAMYLLGIRRGLPRQKIMELSTKALAPAGIIILITGAGGVLKQVMDSSGMGKTVAVAIAASSLSPLLLAWSLAAVVRIAQGSATVAMITAAGIMAPVIETVSYSDPRKALVVIAIASGATILSHVNDSGFWLVGKYLGMNEKQTLRSWTAMETIIALSGLVLTLVMGILIP
jgi:Gnt-I system low-affinity gluconate transporter